MTAAAFPPAEGRRIEWSDVPAAVQRAVADRFGTRVVEAQSQRGGFSPGLAARLTGADGSRVFVKAVSTAQNPDSPALHRREAMVAGALPRDAPTPKLLWTFDDGDWIVLGFEDLDGVTPSLPWEQEQLDRVLSAIADLAAAMTPSPIAVEPASTPTAAMFTGWRTLAGAGAGRGEAGEAGEEPWSAHLDELIALETLAADATDGDTLLHLDLRADNILLTADGVYFVDWPWAAVGAPWVDLAAMLPSVAMQGGPAPESIWRDHPVARAADRDAVDAFLAGLTGFFTHGSLQPPSPGLPTLRAFQAAQATTAYAWLAHRRGWT